MRQGINPLCKQQHNSTPCILVQLKIEQIADAALYDFRPTKLEHKERQSQGRIVSATANRI